MSRDTVDGGLTLTGTIKWFDPVKGFGFIVSDEIDMDILLHANVLRNFGQSSIADGVEIKVIAHRSDRGIQASEVLSVASPRSFNTFGYGEMDALDDVALSEMSYSPGGSNGSTRPRVSGLQMCLESLRTYLCISMSCVAVAFRVWLQVKGWP